MFKFLWMFIPKFVFFEAGGDGVTADSLLNMGQGEGGELPDGEKPPAQKPAEDKSAAKIAGLEKSVKDSQELIRQQSETIGDLTEFKDNITGDSKSPEKEKAQKEQELRAKYDEDPVGTMMELMDQKVNDRADKTDEKVDKTTSDLVLKSIMQEVGVEYEIDFDKAAPKIVEQLKNFDKAKKKADPKGMLIKAMTLAGVLKKREEPTFVQGSGTGKSPAAKQKEADTIRNRVFGKGGEKKTIFE